MKIKQDFITNSSSTSYLVYIPDNFDIRKFKDMIKVNFQDDVTEYCDNIPDKPITEDEFFQFFFNEFNNLIKQGDLYQYDNSQLFYLASNIIDELELVLSDEPTGSDAGLIQNVNVKIIKEKINTIKSGGWGLKYGGWGHESKD